MKRNRMKCASSVLESVGRYHYSHTLCCFYFFFLIFKNIMYISKIKICFRFQKTLLHCILHLTALSYCVWAVLHHKILFSLRAHCSNRMKHFIQPYYTHTHTLTSHTHTVHRGVVCALSSLSFTRIIYPFLCC